MKDPRTSLLPALARPARNCQIVKGGKSLSLELLEQSLLDFLIRQLLVLTFESLRPAKEISNAYLFLSHLIFGNRTFN